MEGLDQEPINVYGDEGKVRQILVNLLGNAVKFTDQGRVVLKLEREESDRYIFKVMDSGCGISPEGRVKIFEPFKQEEGGVSKGGTGLGLAISYELAELMGGRTLNRLSSWGRFLFFNFSGTSTSKKTCSTAIQ